MTAPAVVSRAASHGQLQLQNSPLALLGSSYASKAFAKLAIGEIISDKTPLVPSRLKPASLAWRLAAGGVCGAAVGLSEGEPIAEGAALGAAGALIGSLLGYLWRTQVGAKLKVPDLPLALLEDAVAVGTGLAIVSCPRANAVQDAWADEENPAWLP